MNKYDILFESERINYVKVSLDLIKDYVDMINDINVQKFISREKRIYTVDEEIEWIKCKKQDNALIFSMIEKGTNKFIGNIEIMEIKNNVGEVGIAITSSMQDKHFGQEALTALINYAFNILKLDGLDLNVYSSNKRGIHCYEKVGFVQIGEGKTKEDIHMKISK